MIAPSIVVEDKGVFEAFGRSRELVRGQGWQVFGAIVLAFLIVFAVGLVASIIGAAIGDAGRVILQPIANVLTAPVAALVSSILFFDLGGGQGAPSSRRMCRRPPRRRRPLTRRRRPRRRPPSRLLRRRAVLSLAAADAAEELSERSHLVLIEDVRQLALDVLDVPRGRVLELAQPVVGEDRVADPGVLLAGALPDQPLVLEAVEQAGDPRGESRSSFARSMRRMPSSPARESNSRQP